MPSAGPPVPATLFLQENRGLLLDLTVFLANVLFMWMLVPRLASVIVGVAREDPSAMLVLSAMLVALFLLPPIGAVLKRHRFHMGRGSNGSAPDDVAVGCLFNPILYFVLQLVIMLAAGAFLIESLAYDRDSFAVMGTAMFSAAALAALNTHFVFRFFSPPGREPEDTVLSSRGAALLGDACIFLNMLVYQLVWNWLVEGVFQGLSSGSEFFYRLLFVSVVSLFIYFPPRMFYLVEDVNKPRTWLSILLANAPLILRAMFAR